MSHTKPHRYRRNSDCSVYSASSTQSSRSTNSISSVSGRKARQRVVKAPPIRSRLAIQSLVVDRSTERARTIGSGGCQSLTPSTMTPRCSIDSEDLQVHEKYERVQDVESERSGLSSHKFVTHQPKLEMPIRGAQVQNGLQARAALARASYTGSFGDIIETHACVSISGVVDMEKFDFPTTSLRLTLLVDTSNSMKGYRSRHAASAIRALLDVMAPGDYISVISFSDGVKTLVDNWRKPKHPGTPKERAVRASLSSLDCGGGTNMRGGLQMGMTCASRHFEKEDKNHILVLTDGYPDDSDGLVALVSGGREKGISTSAIGLGEFNEDLLMALADAGGGNCYYAESAADLKSQLREEICSLQILVARDLRVRVSCRESVVIDDIYGYDYRRGRGLDVVRTAEVVVGDIAANSSPRDVLVQLSWTVKSFPEGKDAEELSLALLDIEVSYDCPLTGHVINSSSLTARIQRRRGRGGDAKIRATPAVDLVVKKLKREAVSKALASSALAIARSGDTVGLRVLQERLRELRGEANDDDIRRLVGVLDSAVSNIHSLSEYPKGSPEYRKQQGVVVKQMKLAAHSLSK
eukprot:gnl/Dysnectes_brevis/6818_a10855_334.p1 GENE.gnl/Dysnectes_brevis/6818_a10855_334~~gnl/Dysnectes_brevis/6818_a10855_334.p1  ORF type:complete len:581 (-),score=187.83 gnl/Dysnectes_brevis/6818_a10855_334:402-2144(-)